MTQEKHSTVFFRLNKGTFMATLNILFVKNDPYRLVTTEKKIIYFTL